MNRTMTMLIVCAMLAGVPVMFPGPARAEQKGSVKSIDLPSLQIDLANGPDRDATSRYCGICHGLEYIPMQPRMSKAQWTATVTKMIKVFGAPIPEKDADTIAGYLSTAYGTGN